ncbi:unnamed protein product, partial [Owenia fusiformis]
DSSDSDESVYSGLEEEESSSEDEIEEQEPTSEDGSESDDAEDKKTNNNKEIALRQQKLNKRNDKLSRRKGTKQAKANINEAGPSVEKVPDEYDFDSSDEEDVRNTIGNIPVEWYNEYPHIGYNIEGQKLIKPKKKDEIDEVLSRADDPNYWRTVKDKLTGQDVTLTEEDIATIKKVKGQGYPTGVGDPYEPWVDFFTYEKMIHPVTNRPEHKRSFVPSRWEKLKVGRLVHAMKMGWIKPRPPKTDDDEQPNYYNLWSNEDQSEISKRFQHHIPAPKLALPGHAESYNPPPEYLFTEEEELAWKEKEPEDRRQNFIPQKFSCLRHVPAYSRFINERFERCLDLYLCPRQRKMRMNVDLEDLLPKLPKPKDLQPFPTVQAILYEGHTGLVRCISVDNTGQWLASGCDDKSIKIWEVSTGRCMKTYKTEHIVKSIAWNPNGSFCLLAAVLEKSVILLNPHVGDKLISTNTDNMLAAFRPDDTTTSKKSSVSWSAYEDEQFDIGFRLQVTHQKECSQVTWHGKGDYFSTVVPQGDSQSVFIHQLSRRRSQIPFSKSKGLVQCVTFHPTKPFFYVATQRYIRVYNLVKQELLKKLFSNCKWVSSLAIHPGGDNLLIGSYDCKLSWFDLDLSSKPYQTLRHHKKAIRQVRFHRTYPLFASAADDGSIIVCHGMVYSDMLQNPLIVPVKILRGHSLTNNLGVLDCTF